VIRSNPRLWRRTCLREEEEEEEEEISQLKLLAKRTSEPRRVCTSQPISATRLSIMGDGYISILEDCINTVGPTGCLKDSVM
jgi:hypothetical protein